MSRPLTQRFQGQISLERASEKQDTIIDWPSNFRAPGQLKYYLNTHFAQMIHKPFFISPFKEKNYFHQDLKCRCESNSSKLGSIEKGPTYDELMTGLYSIYSVFCAHCSLSKYSTADQVV